MWDNLGLDVTMTMQQVVQQIDHDGRWVMQSAGWCYSRNISMWQWNKQMNQQNLYITSINHINTNSYIITQRFLRK